jgi:hypothetical protein
MDYSIIQESISFLKIIERQFTKSWKKKEFNPVSKVTGGLSTLI